MIVGNGMLASAFSGEILPEGTILFASGVSNSATTDPEEYRREWDLLNTQLRKGGSLIYFSTTSVLDPTLQHTPYVEHKLNIEALLLGRGSQNIVVRLPIVVGVSSNPHTLINFLYHSIMKGRPFKVHAKACRYLIGLDDVVEVIKILARFSEFRNRSINVCWDNVIPVPALVRLMEEETEKKGVYALEDSGACVQVDNTMIRDDLRFKKFFGRGNHNRDLIHNYIRLMRKNSF